MYLACVLSRSVQDCDRILAQYVSVGFAGRTRLLVLTRESLFSVATRCVLSGEVAKVLPSS